jgi:hypothetical protein
MGDPFHSEVIGEFNDISQLIFDRIQLVCNDPVVNSADPCFCPIVQVIEILAFFDQFRDANNIDANEFLGAIKINPGFLLMGFNFQEYDFFCLVVANDYLLEKFNIRYVVDAIEEAGVSFGYSKMFFEYSRIVSLKTK